VKLYRTALLTVLAPISWGTTYVTITELAPAGRPLGVAAVRVLPAALILLLVGSLWQPWRPHGADWWRTAVLSVCNFSAFFPLLIVAVYRLPGGVAAAAGGLQPLLVAGLSVPLANRRPTAGELAVGAIAAVGVGLVVVRPGADVDPFGVAAAVAANVSFAAGVVLTKRGPSPSRRLAATGWQLLLGGALLVPLAAAVEGAPPGLTATNVVGLGYLTLVATALAFLVWFSGIERLPAPAPPLLGLAAPVTGAVLGWLLLGQSLSPAQLVGFAITLATIAYAAQSAAEPTRPRTSPTHGRKPSHDPILVDALPIVWSDTRSPGVRVDHDRSLHAAPCRASCGTRSSGTKVARRSVDTQTQGGTGSGSCPGSGAEVTVCDEL
jgi:probable blue pigment (indigoidine) exporter